MNCRKLPAEGLKLIACLTMLADHVGLCFGLGMGFRIVGRIAFPIYCFLIAEGLHYTKDLKKYVLRLSAAMLISEIPFDLCFRGRLTLSYQNVLLTLLLGIAALTVLKQVESPVRKLLALFAILAAAEIIHCDYRSQGVLMVVLFGLAREYGWSLPKIGLGLAFVSLVRGSIPVAVLGLPVPVELFSLLALVPLACYSGKKLTKSRWVQWAFYLFYPVHLAILALIIRT